MERVSPILCLGEAIVDLICERPDARDQVPERLVPYPGGALANVAVAITRAGSPAALAGGVGTDHWGSWLARRLEEEEVSTRWLTRLDGVDTPLGIAMLGPGGEPEFQIYGEHIGTTMAAVDGLLPEAVDASSALVVGSNTMVGPVEREVTRRAVELARELGRPVLLDPNFRPGRWAEREAAREYCVELARTAAVVKLNRAEAELLTGEPDLATAVRDLAEAGTGLVVATDGAGTILTGGAVETSFRPAPAEVVSPLGAGDAFMGTLAAGLARVEWDLTRAGETLEPAATAAATVCRHLGAQG
ncbi:MAG: carbohydrate kinase [Solirubrobacterales bacterium]|nr:carbohydrate kinase [Solirubrobacterales bacterium]